MEASGNWYVVYTRPRWEKKVAATLLHEGIEHYCPLNKVTKQWSDRKKIVMEPLFKGYVFVRPVQVNKWDLKKIDGIINFVYWDKKLAQIKEQEIDTIKRFLHQFKEVTVVTTHAALADEVLVNQGLFMDLKGLVVETFGNKAKVKIDSMGVSLIATFDIKNLTPIRKAPPKGDQ